MSSAPAVPAWKVLLPGLLLFLFIPLVLFLYLKHPEPVGLSLGAAVALMIGHRFLARPYMVWAAPRKCLWSNKPLAEDQGVELEIHHRGGVQEARCLERHQHHVERFFTFVFRFRGLLAPGIFVPLLMLLIALLMTAAGTEPFLPLDTVVAIFQLVVGLTVNLAAWGFFIIKRSDQPLQVRFPVHNFFLLGISNLLWIFRLMGTWWIVVAGRQLFF